MKVFRLHVLVRGEKNVEAQLAADAPALVFPRLRENFPGFHICLKPAVVDADGEVDLLAAQLGKCLPCRRKGVRHGDACHVFRCFKLRDKGRDDAGQAHTQPVFHRDNGGFLHAADAFDVRAQADGMQAVQIPLNDLFAVVKVVVSKRHKIIAAEVQKLRRERGDVAYFVA